MLKCYFDLFFTCSFSTWSAKMKFHLTYLGKAQPSTGLSDLLATAIIPHETEFSKGCKRQVQDLLFIEY